MSKKIVKKVVKKKSADKELHDSLLELIRITSTVIPDDIQKVILKALKNEEKNTSAEYAMNIITIIQTVDFDFIVAFRKDRGLDEDEDGDDMGDVDDLEDEIDDDMEDN